MNVLIVDDHPLFREGLQFVLSDLSESLSFSSAVGLSTITNQMLEDADLILLDLGISDSTGYDSLARLRALAPTRTVVVISSDDNPEVILACIDGGAAGFPLGGQPAGPMPPDVASGFAHVLHVLQGSQVCDGSI